MIHRHKIGQRPRCGINWWYEEDGRYVGLFVKLPLWVLPRQTYWDMEWGTMMSGRQLWGVMFGIGLDWDKPIAKAMTFKDPHGEQEVVMTRHELMEAMHQ